jgi:hypothetical protein
MIAGEFPRWILAQDFGRVRAMAELVPESITLVAAIWQWEGRYLPAIDCTRQPSGEGWFTTVKTPVKRWKLPINAARTAQHDLMKAAAELDPPRTELDAFLFTYKMGYRLCRGAMIDEVVTAERVIRHEAKIDALVLEFRPQVDTGIREGDPPIMKETFERLIGEGISSEEAANLITRAFAVEFFKQDRKKPSPALLKETFSRLPQFPFDTPYLNPSFRDQFEARLAQGPELDDEQELPGDDDEKEEFPSGGMSYAMQILRRQKEGVADKTILHLNPFEQLVLEAMEELASSRLHYAEGITAMASLLSGQDISVISVFDILNSLETRYAVFTWFPDPLEYPHLAGKQYFRTTEIGQRSLKKTQAKSAGH